MLFNKFIKWALGLNFLSKFRFWIELRLWRHQLNKMSLFVPQEIVSGANRKSFLISSTIGGNLSTLALDLVLARALELRGHYVRFVLCGGGFDACMFAELNKYRDHEDFIESGSQPLCKGCTKSGSALLKASKLNSLTLIPKYGNRQLKEYELEVAEAGAKRFLGIGRVENLELYRAVLNRFQSAGAQYSQSIDDLLSTEHFDVVIAHHGIYVPQGLFQTSSNKAKVKFVSWMQGYRRGTYIFSWNDTYHRELLKPFPINTTLSFDQTKEIEEYLDSRDSGSNDWIKFGVTTKSNSQTIDFDDSKPSAVLLTNVSWDAQLHYESRVFSDMHEWILQTIRWFIDHPNCNLIVRIHPAEETGRIKSKDKVEDFIKYNFSSLPKNIILVKPLDKISTYSIIEKSDLAIIYGTKTGLEVAAMGKPLLIAGEAWSRNKGVGIEPTSTEEYFKSLEDFAEDYTSLYCNRTKGLELAYYFFFRKLIKVNSIRPITFYPYARPKMSFDWFQSDIGLRSIILSLENELEFEFPTK